MSFLNIWKMLQRNNLHGYQRTAVEHIKEHPDAALFLDMGLGKTVSTLTAVADLINEFEVTKVLIVAPKRVAEMTWPLHRTVCRRDRKLGAYPTPSFVSH